MKGIRNGRIITSEEVLDGKILLFEDKIIDIIEESLWKDYRKENGIADIEWIDAKGNYVSPGFIDIHIHGSGGCDTMDGSVESLAQISRTITESGVTSYLPTTMTMEKDKIYKALDTIKEAMGKDIGGAKILGAHMEGPFINEIYKGAQSEKSIVEPHFDFIEGYLDTIKVITLAPERDKGHSFIKKIKKNTDIVMSIGHSNATYEEAQEAIQNGISHATHTFNAMTPLNHRKPGIIGAIFNSDISCEIIADTIHVHPALFQLLVKVKGKEKVVLITDCMRAGGMKEGTYDLGGQEVVVKDNSARLTNGTLAGSVLSLNTAVKNMLKHTDLEMNEIVAMASLNPAKVLRIDDVKGSLVKGKDADITIFDDKGTVYTTIVEGKNVFNLA